MATDCTELNLTEFQPTLHSTSGQIVTLEEIIGSQNKEYMLLILLSSIIMLGYVLYTNFLLGTKYDVLTKYNIDVHELAILPAIALFIISISFFGVI